MKSGLYIVLLTLFFNSCKNSNNYSPEFSNNKIQNTECYTIGIHPLHNPERLFEVYSPLAKYLSDNIPNTKFIIEASRNYAAFNEKLFAQKFDFAMPNPYQTTGSFKHHYNVFCKWADDENFRGIILVRKDGEINKIADLKGKLVCFPAPTALAACMLPQYYLYKHGLNINTDYKIRYVGSQESSILNVYRGDVSAACTWIPPWNALIKEKPEIENQVEIKWATDNLPNNSFVVNRSIPADIVEQVKTLLISLNTTIEGQIILKKIGVSKFEYATNETYQPVIDFLKLFNKEVRPIDF